MDRPHQPRPDEVRAPAAALTAFSCWLDGNGAAAWFALDEIPEQHRDMRLTTAVQQGLPPNAWDDHIRDTHNEPYVDEVPQVRRAPEAPRMGPHRDQPPPTP